MSAKLLLLFLIFSIRFYHDDKGREVCMTQLTCHTWKRGQLIQTVITFSLKAKMTLPDSIPVVPLL